MSRIRQQIKFIYGHFYMVNHMLSLTVVILLWNLQCEHGEELMKNHVTLNEERNGKKIVI